MVPILCKIGGVTLYTYGLFIALGFMLGLGLARREARRLGVDPDTILDLGIYVLISAIVGSRLFYVATMPAYFIAHPVDALKIWQGGLVFYGGFAGAALVTIAFCRYRRIRLWKMADIAAPSVAIGQAAGRIGCFFAGCCYGKPSGVPWAITFSHPEGLAPLQIPLHPTQLYSAATNLLIFMVLWRRRQRTRFEGELFWTYTLLYGLTRSVIEVFRGDFRGALVADALSPAQTIGLSVAVISAAVLVLQRRRRSSPP